ncbi:MAG: Rpn family recombination-promoting nuclease/putative transposase [Campylobacterales bacterium]|nr:Rpn family recombination-promoting nuclease/putative transposase [Campylobacterales bacterium]
MQFVDPKNDLAFKKIFGDEHKKEILISLLNAVLDFTGSKIIVDVHLVNPYQVPKIADLKETILDIKAKNKEGEEFIVEMQKKDLGDFSKRSLYYTSKAYVSQLGKGKDYSNLSKVYFIGIVDFTMFEGESFISRHLILNKETLKQELQDFEFTFVELGKFHKELGELSTVLEKWVYFIKNANNLTMIPKEFENSKEFEEAFKIATQYDWDIKELEIYDYMTMKAWDEINALKTAERKGLEKGLEKGIEQGIEQGKLEIAKNAILQGLENDTIAFITALDINIIEKLRGSQQ